MIWNKAQIWFKYIEFDEDMMNEVGKEIEMTEQGDEEFSLGYQDEYEEDDDDIVA